jgi:hypothetical protein
MTDRNVIVEAVDGFFKSKGLVKHSGSWYRRTVETISVFNLQKSQYGRRYYLNFGIWILSVEDTDFPKPHKCHLVGRIDRLIEDEFESKGFDALLDLEQPVADGERRSELIRILDEQLIPFLDYSGAVEELRGTTGRFIVSASGIRRPVVSLFPRR